MIPSWGSKECGGYKNVFTFQLMTVGEQEDRNSFVCSLLDELWSARYEIREEAHGIPTPDGSQVSTEAEYFDVHTLPITWTKWLNLPEPVTQSTTLADRDAVITDWDVDLTRQASRKQSATLHRILDKRWLELQEMTTEDNAKNMELLTAKGDVSKLQRIITFVVDGFCSPDNALLVDRVCQLRDFVLYFMHNPTSDSASGFNSHIKKRVVQWYTMPPGTFVRMLDVTAMPIVKAWNTFLVRTPATRTLSKLLEARRFFARSHRPMDVSYNRVAAICKRLFVSSDVWKRGVALMFCLGTRPNELFRSFVEFRPVDTLGVEYGDADPVHWVYQIGTSKASNTTKLILDADTPSENEKRVAIKPILFGFSSHDVIECINQLRMEANELFVQSAMSAGLSMDEAPTSAITLTVVQKLTRTMYSVFQDEGDECTTRGHLFGGLFSRKFYACAALLEFRDAYIDHITPNQFVSQILMHQPGMPTDSVHYVTLRVKYGAEDAPYTAEMKDPEDFSRKRKMDTTDGDNKKSKRRSAQREDGSLYTQTGETITLKTQTKEKTKVQVNRFTHRKFQSEAERQEYYEAVKQYLVDNNIRPSIANLTAIGVSPQFQTARKNHYKKALEEMNKAVEMVNELKTDVDALGKEVEEYGDTANDDTTDSDEQHEPTTTIKTEQPDDEDYLPLDLQPPLLTRQNAMTSMDD